MQGKPTPEQVEELKQVKEELRRLEEELAAAEATRDGLLQKVPNPPHESAPDEEQDDSEGAIEREVGDKPDLADGPEHLELGRFDMERAARVSGARFGYLIGDTALLRSRSTAGRSIGLRRPASRRCCRRSSCARRRCTAPASSRREERVLRDRRGRPLPDRHVRGRARGAAHGRDPRGRAAAAPVHRLLDELPARGGRRGP